MISLNFKSPIINNKDVIEKLDITPVTVTNFLNRFEDISILTEIAGKKR